MIAVTAVARAEGSVDIRNVVLIKMSTVFTAAMFTAGVLSGTHGKFLLLIVIKMIIVYTGIIVYDLITVK